jgi:hypothetical protein
LVPGGKNPSKIYFVKMAIWCMLSGTLSGTLRKGGDDGY